MEFRNYKEMRKFLKPACSGYISDWMEMPDCLIGKRSLAFQV